MVKTEVTGPCFSAAPRCHVSNILRYRFIVCDERKLIAQSLGFPSTNAEMAVQLAQGWRPARRAGGATRR
jgi:hypothetical protein